MALLVSSPTLVAIVYGGIDQDGRVCRVDRVLDLTSCCRSLDMTVEQEWLSTENLSGVMQRAAGLRSTVINAEFNGSHHISLESAVMVVRTGVSVTSHFGHIQESKSNTHCIRIKFAVSRQETGTDIPQWLRIRSGSQSTAKEMTDIDQQLTAVVAKYNVSYGRLKLPELEPDKEKGASPVIVRRKRTITTIEEV